MSLVFTILNFALTIFQLVLLARVILSWFPNVDRSNPLIQFLYDVTEPVLRPIREMLPPGGMIDFSPIIVFLIITVLQRVLQAIF